MPTEANNRLLILPILMLVFHWPLFIARLMFAMPLQSSAPAKTPRPMRLVAGTSNAIVANNPIKQVLRYLLHARVWALLSDAVSRRI